MKLYYSGNHLKIKRIVNRANELLVSPFYMNEIKKFLIAKGQETKMDVLKALLEKDKKIRVKSYFNIISRKRMRLKNDTIGVNTLRLNVSHRDLLALLTENIFRSMDSNNEISNLLNLKSKPEKDLFLKEMGDISKSYI